MFSVDVHDQRIVLVRVRSLDSVDEANALGRELMAAVSRARGQLVGTADFRAARIFSPPVTDAMVGILRGENARFDRSAFLVGAGATFTLQIERVVREAANPRRRTFRDVTECEAYLGEVLGPAQRSWLHQWFEST